MLGAEKDRALVEGGSIGFLAHARLSVFPSAK